MGSLIMGSTGPVCKATPRSRQFAARAPIWCIAMAHASCATTTTAANWLRAHRDGVAAPVVLASTAEEATEIVPLAVLREYAVDVPDDPRALDD